MNNHGWFRTLDLPFDYLEVRTCLISLWCDIFSQRMLLKITSVATARKLSVIFTIFSEKVISSWVFFEAFVSASKSLSCKLRVDTTDRRCRENNWLEIFSRLECGKREHKWTFRSRWTWACFWVIRLHISAVLVVYWLARLPHEPRDHGFYSSYHQVTFYESPVSLPCWLPPNVLAHSEKE